MPDLKDVLQRIRTMKQERKKTHEAFRDMLSQSKPYQNVLEQIKDLQTKKRRLEAEMRQGFLSEVEKGERLKENLKSEAQLLSDMALTKFMKGETIAIVDENDVKYEPIFKVTFKRSS